MMALKNWVDELQSQLLLDPATGFIASLHLFLKQPAATSEVEETKTDYFKEFGIQIKEKIQGQFLCERLLRKLHQKRSVVVSVANIDSDSISVDLLNKRHSEPIWKIFCTLVEKTLQKELRRFQMMKREMPQIIKHDTFLKSFLIYACVIYFYSKNINDLSVQEMLA